MDVYENTLKEIGRITTTWAKFEHWIDQAIWILSGVDARTGACVTSRIGSIHGKFRALLALVEEAKRPQAAIKIARKLSDDAAKAIVIRNSFAHGPLDMGLNFGTREFEVYLRRVGNTGKSVMFETVPLMSEYLQKALAKVSDLYLSLVKN